MKSTKLLTTPFRRSLTTFNQQLSCKDKRKSPPRKSEYFQYVHICLSFIVHMWLKTCKSSTDTQPNREHTQNDLVKPVIKTLSCLWSSILIMICSRMVKVNFCCYENLLPMSHSHNIYIISVVSPLHLPLIIRLQALRRQRGMPHPFSAHAKQVCTCHHRQPKETITLKNLKICCTTFVCNLFEQFQTQLDSSQHN